MRSELFCKYQKNRDPKNYFHCTDPCISLFPHDDKTDEFMVTSCNYFPKGNEYNDDFWKEINKALDEMGFKGNRGKLKFV